MKSIKKPSKNLPQGRRGISKQDVEDQIEQWKKIQNQIILIKQELRQDYQGANYRGLDKDTF